MKREVYVFMDGVSQNFGEPFCLSNFAELQREFRKICDNPAIPSYAIRDTIVIHLGTFYPDPVCPRVEPLAVPVTVLRGDAFYNEENRRQDSDYVVASSELPSV